MDNQMCRVVIRMILINLEKIGTVWNL